MIHELKILPKFFKSVISGERAFDIRKNDRPFQKGDLLALNEYDENHYTGKSCLVYIDYIMHDPEYVKEGTVILAIKPCTVFRHTQPYNPDRRACDYSVPLASEVTRKCVEVLGDV